MQAQPTGTSSAGLSLLVRSVPRQASLRAFRERVPVSSLGWPAVFENFPRPQLLLGASRPVVWFEIQATVREEPIDETSMDDSSDRYRGQHLLTIPSAAQQRPRPSPEEVFARLDTNGDKKLSLEEYTAQAKDEQAKQKNDRAVQEAGHRRRRLPDLGRVQGRDACPATAVILRGTLPAQQAAGAGAGGEAVSGAGGFVFPARLEFTRGAAGQAGQLNPVAAPKGPTPGLPGFGSVIRALGSWSKLAAGR